MSDDIERRHPGSPDADPVASPGFWRRWWLLVIMLTASLLPFLALIPLGGLWLWEQGFVLWWLLAAAVLGAGGYGAALWLRRRTGHVEGSPTDGSEENPLSAPDADWSPHELEAWAKVQRLAASADMHLVGDSDLLLAAARETIETVADHFHPDLPDPIWRFTLPEALMLTERVSARLRVVLLDSVPGSHLVRAGQLRRIWALKPSAAIGMRAFGHVARVYRLARLVNPVSAVLAEARERLIGAALGESGVQLRRKGARIWIEEVGRAAIELYSGRLRTDLDALRRQAEAAPALGAEPTELPGALQLLVAGQTNAGKSSLVNALLGELAAPSDVLPLTAGFTRYRLGPEAGGEAEIVDAPGVDGDAMAEVVDAACEADFLIWVVAAHRPDRAQDRRALDSVRAWFAARPERSMPPVIAVMTHIDRLSPAREWRPPYDVAAPAGAKETAIRHALEAVAADLSIAHTDIVPVRLQPLEQAYNVELVWALLAERLRIAHGGRLLRLLHTAPRRDWRRLLRQAGGGGRLLLGSLSGSLPGER